MSDNQTPNKRKPTVEQIKKEYSAALDYNNSIALDDNVKINENYFVGKQWEHIKANGLPTPVFNFIKRAVLFAVASITTDNIKMQATPMGNAAEIKDADRACQVVNKDFDELFEVNKISAVIREFMRNAAVDGDGCTHTYWDSELETGLKHGGAKIKGGIVTEVLPNTKVFFGDPAERRVQKQPFILIESREETKRLKDRAKSLGCSRWDEIQMDTNSHDVDSYKHQGDNKTTVILRYWRDSKTKTIWACEATADVMIREPYDTKLKLYPITWINWDYVQDSYHGMAMLTGLIPNQDFVNKAYAMSMVSMMTTAFPKIIYDRTRIPKWSNGVGQAIGVNGGDVSNVAKIMDPAQISPQISQFIQQATDQTQTFLGATPAAMGDTRPDNTSAIIALQRAAAIPSDITKQNMFQCIEDLGRIYVDFMATNYGKRTVMLPLPDDTNQEMLMFAGFRLNEPMAVEFDYKTLADMPMTIKLDVGASSYWSEIAATQTLDNLLMNGHITVEEYLERIPSGTIPKLQELIEAHRQPPMMGGMMPGMDMGGGEAAAQPMPGSPQAQTLPGSIEVRGGGGYGALQRAINNTGEIPQ